ncbi:MAG: ABC transporter ATP-binding protein [Phycisphaeraceae bacterium]|nr:ABC transporter ATP-binding protein [Phycisphaeraceae bacterium]
MIPLRVHGLGKRFEARGCPAVDNLHLEVAEKELLALVGPSGCGKTTTLRLIAGLERPDAGRIEINGRVVEDGSVHLPPEQRPVGLVFQEMAVFPHLTVLKNVMFGLHRLPRSERKPRAMEVLQMVGMADLADRKPHELSGGQQQRVALARSLAPSPSIILLDEPFSHLDPALRDDARHEIKQLLRHSGTAALLVTHDQEEALSFADRIGVMRDGHLCQLDSPAQIYNHPTCAFVAKFLGQTNLIEAKASGQHAQTSLGPICLACPARGEVLLSIRPEHLKIVPPAEGQPTGRVMQRHFKGHDLTYVVRMGDRDLTIQADYTSPFQVGQEVSLVHTEPANVVDPADHR